jgi:hypothetical protein
LLIYLDSIFTNEVYAQVAEFVTLERFPTVTNFTTPEGRSQSVMTGLIRRQIEYAQLKNAFSDILALGDLERLDRAGQEIDGLIARHPSSRKYLTPILLNYKREKERYLQGEGKWDGQWYATRQAALDARQRPLILAEMERQRQAAELKLAQEREIAEQQRLAAAAKMEAERLENAERKQRAEEQANAVSERRQADTFRKASVSLLTRLLAEIPWLEPVADYSTCPPLPAQLHVSIERTIAEWVVLSRQLRDAEALQAGATAIPALEGV